MTECFEPTATMRALLPRGFVECDGAPAIVGMVRSWFGCAGRQDYTIAFNLSGVAIDDPDVTITENFACKSENNFSKYCNPKKTVSFQSRSEPRDSR